MEDLDPLFSICALRSWLAFSPRQLQHVTCIELKLIPVRCTMSISVVQDILLVIATLSMAVFFPRCPFVSKH